MYTGLFFNLKQGSGAGSEALAPAGAGWGTGGDYCVHLVFLFIPCFERLVWLWVPQGPLARVAMLMSQVAWAPHRWQARPCWRPLSKAQVPIDQFDPV